MDLQARVEGAGGTLHQPAPRQEARSATRAPGGKQAAAPGRVDIRPGTVVEKSRVGDREGDKGAPHQGIVLSLVDQASRFTLLALRVAVQRYAQVSCGF